MAKIFKKLLEEFIENRMTELENKYAGAMFPDAETKERLNKVNGEKIEFLKRLYDCLYK